MAPSGHSHQREFMSLPDRLRDEFEGLGEAELESRIRQNLLDDYQRVYALRWLSDQSLGRATEALEVRQATDVALARRVLIRRRVVAGSLLFVIVIAAIILAVWLLNGRSSPAG